MNELNYASLEASKRLVEAGIVLETDAVWFFSTTGWELVQRYAQHPVNKHYVPAPSIAEVWRELPEATVLSKVFEKSFAYVKGKMFPVIPVINPVDALIDLLIWVRKEVVTAYENPIKSK